MFIRHLNIINKTTLINGPERVICIVSGSHTLIRALKKLDNFTKEKVVTNVNGC